MANKKKPEVGTPEDKFQHYAEELKKKVDSLGGREEAIRRVELTGSILYYSSRAREKGIDTSKTDNIIEYILNLFREEIATKGYKGVNHNMISPVYYYGTIKDKAALCLQYFDYFRTAKDGKHPPVSKRTIDSLRQKVADSGKENLQEFVFYISVYEAYKKISKHFYFVEGVYFSTIFQTALYIQNYEWITRTADLLTAMRPLITKSADGVSEEAIKAFADVIDKQNEYLLNSQRYGELKIVNNKVEDKEALDCLDFAKGMAVGIAPVLSKLKGIIEGIKEWNNDTEGNPYKSILMPQEIREVIVSPSEKLTISEVQDKYYKCHLKEMEEKGESITDQDKAIAILPLYSDVEVDENLKKQTIETLYDTIQKK